MKLLLLNSVTTRWNASRYAFTRRVSSLLPPRWRLPHLVNEQIGDLVLLTNEVLKKEPPDLIVDDDAMLVEFLGNWDITNTDELAPAMTRVDRMIRDLLYLDDARIAALRNTLHIELGQFDSCSLEEHQALTFSIYSAMHSGAVNGTTLMRMRDVPRWLRIPRRKITRFFRAHSWTVPQAAAELSVSSPSHDHFSAAVADDAFLLDMAWARQRPFLRVGRGRVLVVDLQYVAELSASGLYWHWARGVDPTQRNLVPVLWGYLFHEYCSRLLKHFYPNFCGLLALNVAYDGNEIDALLDLGGALVLFEFKSSKLLSSSVRSRDEQLVTSELLKKFVADGKKRKGAGQLARDSEALVRGQVEQFRRSEPQHIFPVLVTEEPLLASFGVNRRLNKIFRASLDPECSAMIRPLTIMSIAELEFVLPYVERQTPRWPMLLGERFLSDEVVPFSVYQALWDLRKRDNLPRLQNEFVFSRWEEIFQRITPLLAQQEDPAVG